MVPPSARSRLGLTAAALLLAANMVAPMIWGDVYPFTSAPMFRDSPSRFCDYRVYAANGQELASADWLVQRIYDGNPVGYGVGVRPPAVLEQEFGVVHDEEVVRRHFQQLLANPRHRQHEFVEVVQETIGLVDAQQVGILQRHRWRFAAAAGETERGH